MLQFARDFTSYILHFLVQVLPFFFVLEVGDKALDCIYHLSFNEGFVCEDSFELIEESVHLAHLIASGLLHNAQRLETLHFYLLAWDVELLIGFLASGVGLDCICPLTEQCSYRTFNSISH